MKLFQCSDNCHLNEVLKTSARQSISLIVLLLATILIIPSIAFAEVHKEYHKNGQLRFKKNFKNGKLEGITKHYYESGKLHFEENYKNGKLEGISKIYYESGQLWIEVNYKNSEREGISKVYYESGKYQYIDTYKNDKKINRKAYTEEGHLKFDQDYPQ